MARPTLVPYFSISVLTCSPKTNSPPNPPSPSACRCFLRPGVSWPPSPPTPAPRASPVLAGQPLTNMITPQALRTMPQAASLGPQHRSDTMEMAVGGRLELGRTGRRWNESPMGRSGGSRRNSGASAADNRLEGRGLGPNLRAGGRRAEDAERPRLFSGNGGKRRGLKPKQPTYGSPYGPVYPGREWWKSKCLRFLGPPSPGWNGQSRSIT